MQHGIVACCFFSLFFISLCEASSSGGIYEESCPTTHSGSKKSLNDYVDIDKYPAKFWEACWSTDPRIEVNDENCWNCGEGSEADGESKVTASACDPKCPSRWTDTKGQMSDCSDECTDALRDLMWERCYWRWYENSPQGDRELVDHARDKCTGVNWGWIFIMLAIATVGSIVLLFAAGHAMHHFLKKKEE